MKFDQLARITSTAVALVSGLLWTVLTSLGWCPGWMGLKQICQNSKLVPEGPLRSRTWVSNFQKPGIQNTVSSIRCLHWAGGVALLEECLVCTVSCVRSQHKPSTVPVLQDGSRRPGVYTHPWLHSKLDASLGYMILSKDFFSLKKWNFYVSGCLSACVSVYHVLQCPQQPEEGISFHAWVTDCCGCWE